MTEKPPKPDLTEYEEEDVPLDEVLKRLVEAKPAQKPRGTEKEHKNADEKS